MLPFVKAHTGSEVPFLTFTACEVWLLAVTRVINHDRSLVKVGNNNTVTHFH
jgi:hypothetical protein